MSPHSVAANRIEHRRRVHLATEALLLANDGRLTGKQIAAQLGLPSRGLKQLLATSPRFAFTYEPVTATVHQLVVCLAEEKATA